MADLIISIGIAVVCFGGIAYLILKGGSENE